MIKYCKNNLEDSRIFYFKKQLFKRKSKLKLLRIKIKIIKM